MRVAVLGSGVGGLTTGMLLANDGHDVTVLERDPAPPPTHPTACWDDWERRGVNQFRMIHYFLPRFRQVLEAELPEAAAQLRAAGATEYSVIANAPEAFTGGSRADDGRFVALTARRPVAEAALARAAEATAGLDVRRGLAVVGPTTGAAGPDGVPHVTGVRLEDGSEVSADLVVDAGGRRSQLPGWLAEVGAAPVPEELEDCGFAYINCHFRSPDGSLPPMFAPLLSHYGSVSILTLPADNGTWGLGIVVSAKDAELRGLRDPDVWRRTVQAFPLVAHWLEGEPIQDVTSITKVEDRHRSLVVDGTPIATGVVAVADAWACTNPSVGRGSSIGLVHGVALRNVVRKHGGDGPGALERAFHEATMAETEPLYRDTLAYDRHRLAEIEAAIAGRRYDPGDPMWELTKSLEHGATGDPDVFRDYVSVTALLQRLEDVRAKPGFEARARELGAGWREAEVVGPDRAELVALAAR
jgi:2-polyprenyl-6-methoxyphenol hydroxylase-like FAD-dependent oxidoreductase